MNFLKSISTIVIALLFLLPALVKGQISIGGTPVQIEKLKSAAPTDLIVLPSVDNFMLRRANDIASDEPKLKPMHFAHPFDVKLNLKNAGKWYSGDD